MKKAFLVLSLISITCVQVQAETVCIDSSKLQQAVTLIDQVTALLSILREKTVCLIPTQDTGASQDAKHPTRHIDFNAWQALAEQQQSQKPERVETKETSSPQKEEN